MPFRWHCTATQTQGESLCRDKNGRLVGKVFTSRDQVKVFNNLGIPISQGTYIADNNKNSYRVVANKGILEAKVEKISSEDCLKGLFRSFIRIQF